MSDITPPSGDDVPEPAAAADESAAVPPTPPVAPPPPPPPAPAAAVPPPPPTAAVPPAPVPPAPPAYAAAPPPPPAYAAAPGYPAPTASGQSNPAATWALVLGILSLVCCGLFAGIPAIILGNKGKKIAAETGVGGGQAQAGFILGIIGTALVALGWIYVVAMRGGN